MSKLKEEELLKRLRNWWMSLDKTWPSFQLSWTKRDWQAYQQIKEMIKLHFSDDWQQVKKELGKFMQKQKSGITEEWIEEKEVNLFRAIITSSLLGGKFIRHFIRPTKIGTRLRLDFIRSLVKEIHGRK